MANPPRYELPEVHFQTWDSFRLGYVEHLTNMGIGREGSHLFRGHGDSGWRLETRFEREMRGIPGRRSKLKVELLKAFRIEMELANMSLLSRHPKEAKESAAAIGANASRVRASKDVEFGEWADWALGQHYGLPTPLLDWSKSPYVAAFFACEDAVARVKAVNRAEAKALQNRLAIFALRNDEKATVDLSRMGIELIEDANTENRRIRPQLGTFTFLRDGYSDLDQAIGDHCAAAGRPTSELILKFTLPYGEAFEALADLNRMDLNARRIYADLGGVCRAASLSVRLANLLAR
jgi:hypothetical protein